MELNKENNGWIKIESEDDLPKDFTTCYIITIYSYNTIVEAYYSDGERSFKPRDKYSTWSYLYDEITHYQPIIKPKPPIY